MNCLEQGRRHHTYRVLSIEDVLRGDDDDRQCLGCPYVRTFRPPQPGQRPQMDLFVLADQVPFVAACVVLTLARLVGTP